MALDREHALPRWLCDHAGLFVLLCLLCTAALSVPFALGPPEQTASQEPGGPVFEARDRAARRFATAVHRMVFVVEARQGNLLRRAPLRELKRNLDALRADDELGAKLAPGFDARFGRPVKGGPSIADTLDDLLRRRGIAAGLEAASQAQLAQAVDPLLATRSPSSLGLAASTERRDGRWVAPAALVAVLADNAALGGGGATTTLGGGNLQKERFGRAVQRRLRGAQRTIQVWGLALDVNLTSAEQGRAAGPFIGLTIFSVLLLVGFTFRSYWVVALTGFCLGALMVWLKGLSHLIGLKSDQILSIIVPIAMISFGIDFAFHAVGRYREERTRGGVSPCRALVLGLGGVLGALLLALASDAAAFLSNTTSGIESLVQFGIAAALAVLASFVMLGLATPLALMSIEDRLGAKPPGFGGRRSIVGVLPALLAAGSATAAVTVSVFVSPPLGIGLLGVHLLLFVLLPLYILARWGREGPAGQVPERTHGWLPRLTGTLVAGLARRRWIVLSCALLTTGVAAALATRVTVSFEVADFFSTETDFVTGLDRFEHHLGQQSGEPALVLVETDLTRPAALRALRRFVDEIRQLETPRLAQDREGRVRVDRGVLEVLERTMENPRARAAIAAGGAVKITDADADGLPDSRQQIATIIRRARQAGIPSITGEGLALPPTRVQAVIWQPAEAALGATRVGLWLPGSASQQSIREARAALEPAMARLREALRPLAPGSSVVLTGGPIVRQASLDAIFRAFLLSLPVAVLLCLSIAAVVMRRLPFAVVSIVPILLVVVWLYAFMALMGYSINVVTATIGAISIGIGIDFAVHFTMRYREELQRHATRLDALQTAGAGTGVALLASGLSSVVGFAILAFAPMPMFAAFGLLTAVMILMAMIATLAVLPSLLLFVSRDPGQRANSG